MIAASFVAVLSILMLSAEQEPVYRVPVRAGTHRDVSAAAKKGKWQRARNGDWSWRVTLSSPGAKAVRIHFKRLAGDKGSIWIYEPAAAGEPRKGAPLPKTGEDFWSDLTYGDMATVEYVPADRRKSKKLPFEIDLLSHQFR